MKIGDKVTFRYFGQKLTRTVREIIHAKGNTEKFAIRVQVNRSDFWLKSLNIISWSQ